MHFCRNGRDCYIRSKMIGELLKPDDFKGRPYEGGLNQIGHMVLGGAFAVFLGYYAGFAIIAIEAWQYHKRKALKSDYWADLSFWGIGVFLYQWQYFLPLVAVLGFLWMVYLNAVSE